LSAKRSSALLAAQGNSASGAGTVFGLFALIAILDLIVFVGIQAMFSLTDLPDHLSSLFANLPFSGLVTTMIDLIPGLLQTWMILPVWATTVTILYFDRRIRTEGYDIEALAAEIDRQGGRHRFDV
jgi:Na+-transporting methylmalonyl-CoA/oxaloacetate decarboxylase beta subunit